jgi:predicted permease
VRNLAGVDVGYSPDNVLLASVDFEQAGYDPPRGRLILPRLVERLRSVPNVESASAVHVVTPNPGGSNWNGVQLEGYTPPPGELVGFDVNRVGPDYFTTMGIRIVAGRAFDDTDVQGAPRRAIVNESFVRRYSPTESVVGRRIIDGEPPNVREYEIVGVAADGKYRDVREQGTPNVYMPMAQAYVPQVTLIARTRGAPTRIAAAVQQAVREIDASLPPYDVKTLAQHVASATSQDRMVATLASGFGVMALGLAALGLFGVMAFRVAQRTREIGVRVALGARHAHVVGLVLSSAGTLVGLGVAVGLTTALWLGSFAEAMLFGVSSADPLALSVAVAVLLVAGLGAAWLPARRAARVDPMVALRAD